MHTLEEREECRYCDEEEETPEYQNVWPLENEKPP